MEEDAVIREKILHGLRSVPQLFDRKCPIYQKVSGSKQRNAIHVADGDAIGLFFNVRWTQLNLSVFIAAESDNGTCFLSVTREQRVL